MVSFGVNPSDAIGHCRSMPARSLAKAMLVSLPLVAAGSAQAFEVTSQGNVWDRFSLGGGKSANVDTRSFRAPQFAPNLQPIIGLNWENAQVASQVRGAWAEGARLGPLALGGVINVDRHLALTARPGATNQDLDGALRYGGFLAYNESGVEVGRLAITTGRLGGIDLRASRSFKLNDNVSLEIGPTISLGSYERFGFRQAQGAVMAAPAVNADRAQLSAFGLAAALETRVSDRTVARMFADYARVQGLPAGQAQGNRDRVDFGFSLTTRIGQ